MKFQPVLLLLLAVGLIACRGETPDIVQEGAKPDHFDYASGGLQFSVLLNDVGIQVDDVQVRPADADGVAGYVYVVLSVSLVNESQNPIVPGNFVLVDELANRYTSWQTNVPFAGELQALPLALDTGQTARGHQVFIVPTSALSANLRLRWESNLHESRIEIYLGQL